MEDLVVLYSGGADSTLLLSMAIEMKREPLALMIDYKQLHIEELVYAKDFLDNYNIKNMTVEINGYNVNSGLTGSGKKGLYEGVSEFNVPARNSIFLTIAYGIAESRNINEIWFGANFEDYEHLFPDCTQEYIGRFNKMLEVAAVKPIKVYAPLLGMSKEMIKHFLKQFDIKNSEVFSGYGKL